MIADGWLERLGRLGIRRGPNGAVATRRARTRRTRGRTARRRPSPKLIVILGAVAALLGGGWLWLRDSSLVAVQRVTITGIHGPDAGRIRSALAAAAHNMTTLDVQMNELNTAVAPFAVVRSLQVSTQFPHGIRIHVIEQVPVGAISFGGRLQAVAADGTLLHDVQASRSLPVIPLRVAPGGTRLTDPAALGAVAVLAAAPDQLSARISQVTSTTSHGLVAQLRNGPSIYFGDTARLDAKWTAAAAVLASSQSAGAVYIDVTDPQRAAAGAGSTGTSTSSTGASGTGATGAATTATGAGTTAAGTTASSGAATSTGATASGATGTGASGVPGGG